MKRNLLTGLAAATLTLGLVSAPAAFAYEPGTEPITEEEIEQGHSEISFESSDGAYILPEQTLEFTADSVAEGITIRNAYVELEPGFTSAQWTIKRSVNEEDLPVLTITAPKAPEDQFGETQEYGEYTVQVRTSNWNSYSFTINFAPELPEVEEPEKPGEEPDSADGLSSNISDALQSSQGSQGSSGSSIIDILKDFFQKLLNIFR
ncbi:hypothetical protein [Corynebacterium cystitidis]|nr:hypothetical protein [Corynebacterium cystitidis]